MMTVWIVQCWIAAVALLLDQHVAYGKLFNHASTSLGGGGDNGNSQEQEGVKVSSECAAVLVTEGFVLGGLAAAAIPPAFFSLLEALGFAAVGVEAGSKAALWQSTFPLVKAGSLFAKLQSITMSGVESTVIVPGSIAGGAVAASAVHKTCQVIDDVEPESTEGKAIHAVTVAARKILNEGKYVWEKMKDDAGEAKMVLIRETNIAKGKFEDGWEHVKYKAKYAWEHMRPKDSQKLKYEIVDDLNW